MLASVPAALTGCPFFAAAGARDWAPGLRARKVRTRRRSSPPTGRMGKPDCQQAACTAGRAAATAAVSAHAALDTIPVHQRLPSRHNLRFACGRRVSRTSVAGSSTFAAAAATTAFCIRVCMTNRTGGTAQDLRRLRPRPRVVGATARAFLTGLCLAGGKRAAGCCPPRRVGPPACAVGSSASQSVRAAAPHTRQRRRRDDGVEAAVVVVRNLERPP